MTTHEVERLLGVSKQALIYYEKEGMITPSRDSNNYRNYSKSDIELLKLILLLRSMDLSIDDIKLILKEELSIKKALETKQAFIKQSKKQLEDIEQKIKEYIKRYPVRITFDGTISNTELANDNYGILYFKEDAILFDQPIYLQDILSIDISMCSSVGDHGRVYSLLNYYVDIDIHTKKDSYSFQIMNHNIIKDMFTYFHNHHIELHDPLKLEEVYNTYKDSVELHRYLNLHFRKWAKQYHLDNPRDNYFTVMKESYLDPLKEYKNKNRS